jgi:ABC-type Na+ efflux pump permease subunit
MPTRKQRRREQKNRRHEWEYVYVDDEGHEVEVEEDETPAKVAKPVKQGAAKASAKPAAKGGQSGRGAARVVDPPSWQKVARRTAIFAPIMLIVIYLLKPKNASAASLLVQLVVLLLFFAPFSYFMDVMMYRNYRKRIGDPIPPRQRKR